jgi:hypothetical protein
LLVQKRHRRVIERARRHHLVVVQEDARVHRRVRSDCQTSRQTRRSIGRRATLVVRSLQKVSSTCQYDEALEVVSLQSRLQAERQAKSRRLSSSTSSGFRRRRRHSLVTVLAIASTNAPDDETDETMMSGVGQVSKDCDDDVLTNWNEVLIKWKKNYSERPRGLQVLVERGASDRGPFVFDRVRSSCRCSTGTAL